MPLNIKGNIISTGDITSLGVFKTKVNRDGLVCYLDASNLDSYPTTGTTWYDLSGNGNNFTLSGSPTFTSTSPARLTFDGGSSQFAYCVNLVSTNYVTVEMSFKKISELATEDIIFNKEDTWEMHTDTNALEWAVYTVNNTWAWVNVQSISVSTNYVVTLTSDGNTIKTYVNGVLVQTNGSYTGVLANQSNGYPKINSRGAAQTTFSSGGNIDVYDFKIYDRALNPFEIAENFQAIKGRLSL